MKSNVKVQTALAPVPIAMVSCGDELKSNITTIAWTGIINSEPPLVYVSIRPNNKEFVSIMPIEFMLDDEEKTKDPKGKQTKVLRCKAARESHKEI